MTGKAHYWIVIFLIVSVLLAGYPPVADAEQPRQMYQTASQQFWNGQYRKALENYRRIVKDYPESDLYWDAVFGAGKSYFEAGQLNKARKVFQRVQKNHPEKAVRGDALFSMVEVAILRDDIVRARNLLQTFLDLYPNHPIRETAKRQLKLLENPEDSGTQSGEKKGTRADTKVAKSGPPTLKDSENKSEQPGSIPDETTGDTRSLSPRFRNQKSTGDETPAGRSMSRGYDTPANGARSRISPLGTSRDKAPATMENNRETDTAVSTSDNEGASLDDLSSETLRKLRTQAERKDQLDQAYRIARILLDRPSATGRDYYRAAFLSHRLNKPLRNSMKLLKKARSMSTDLPSKVDLLRGELLIERGKYNQASAQLEKYRSNAYRQATPSQKARYHFLKGELLKSQQKKDEAFFQYMSVLQVAPDSRWGTKAQQTVKKEF